MSEEFRAQYLLTGSIHGFKGTIVKQQITGNYTQGIFSANIESPKAVVNNTDCSNSTSQVGGPGGGGSGPPTDNDPNNNPNYDNTIYNEVCYDEWIDFDDSTSCGNNCVTASRSILITVCYTTAMSSSDDTGCDEGEVAVVYKRRPMFKFPEGLNYEILYPKLTEYLSNQMPKVASIDRITNAIKRFTSMTNSEIQEALTWGAGPLIYIKQHNDSGIYASFDKRTPDRLYLDIDYVMKLENSIIGTDGADALAFLIGASILHEFVHWGDFNHNNDIWRRPNAEEGWWFEVEAYGQIIEEHNALLVLKRNN